MKSIEAINNITLISMQTIKFNTYFIVILLDSVGKKKLKNLHPQLK